MVQRAISACTIISRNFLPYARILAESFEAHNPGGDFTVLLIDDEDRAFDDFTHGLSCLRLSDIGLSASDIAELASIYEVTELATAVKPPLLKFLLAQGRDHILYLDPDIKVYDSLETAAALAERHGIVLTPHMTAALPRDGLRIDDAHILSSGIYNLGFIGLGPGADRFIEWWWGKTKRDALVDHEHMMFTDQRWIDYVPAFFRHYILKHPGYNVAYWNLHERDLIWTGNRYLVSGQPLVFFHFSGYCADAPHLLSKHQGDKPRILLSERPALRRICAEYQASFEKVRWRGQPPSYGWGELKSGLAFDRRMRRLYRRGLLEFDRGTCAEPPAPFAREDDFIAWLKHPVAAGCHPRVSRYLYAIYQDRPDLRSAFPNLDGEDCSNYFMWLHDDGVKQEHIPQVMLPPLTECARSGRTSFASPSSLREGVNLAGYFRAELGIGEAARILRSTLESARVPHATIDYSVTESRKSSPFEPRGDGRAPYDVNIVCVNSDRTPAFAKDMGPGLFQGRHTIGYWFWELEQFPASMHAGFDLVDEVWASSRFVADAIERIGRRPVHHVPLAVPIPRCDPRITRDRLQMPPGFLFLFTFDFFSILERKNPLGAIRAFKQAFEPGEGPMFLLKTINGDRCVAQLERIRAEVADRPDIRVIDGYYTAEEKNALIGLCDCYVSLHRAEGFGLTIAEAMALERPVVATAYSGNMDFMTEDNSYLVDYTPSVVPPDCGPYPAGSRWAEPDIDHAATLMRRVVANRREASAKAARARRDIEGRHSVEASARVVAKRLEAIRKDRIAMAIPAQAHTPPRESREMVFMAKRQLFRALRLFGRVRKQSARLVGSLRHSLDHTERIAVVESRQNRALESVWKAVHALEARQQALERTSAPQVKMPHDVLD